MRIPALIPTLLALSCCSGAADEKFRGDDGISASSTSQMEVHASNEVTGEGGPGIVDAGLQFDCTPIRVWDGDGPIWCAEGMRVRLNGIAAREIDGACREGHPCPDAGGAEARDALVGLVGEPVGSSQQGHILVEGPKLSCLSEGSALGTRTAAWCVSPRYGDLSCEMVSRGVALKWDQYWGQHECSG